jgi:hypothetical protein
VAGWGIWLDWLLRPIHSLGQRPYFEQHPDATIGAYFAFFAIMFMIAHNWSGLTARHRSRRFRFRPILYTAILAMLLSPLWPYRRPDGAVFAITMTLAIQLASPWSEEAADYARYVRSRGKRRGRSRTAS